MKLCRWLKKYLMTLLSYFEVLVIFARFGMARIFSLNYCQKPSLVLIRSTEMLQQMYFFMYIKTTLLEAWYILFYRELQTCQSVPSALQIPRGRIRLVPPTLSEKCETYPGLHDIIRNKFLDIVNKWFKVVPSAHDYYFYCPDYSPMDNNVSFFLTKYNVFLVPSIENFQRQKNT